MKFLVSITLFILFHTTNIANAIFTLNKYGNLFIQVNETDLRQNVEFYLYTRKNPKIGQQLWINDIETLKKSYYNPKIPTKFITHGYIGKYLDPCCTKVRDAFLTSNNFNVIVVDWNSFAKVNYIAAQLRMRLIGGYVAMMIDFLESQGSNVSQMTLTGWSLGAHVMGSAGHQTHSKVGHIVGLDPAGPGFNFRLFGEEGDKIKKSDANFVEIIHTNIYFFGLIQPVGHADFYVNSGGPTQPDCKVWELVCPHKRAYEYYAESLLNPKKWSARICQRWLAYLGGWCKRNQIAPFPTSEPVAKPEGVYMLQIPVVSS